MASGTPTVAACLEKMQSEDKDFRYMATSDLQNLLEAGGAGAAPDPTTQASLVSALLTRLTDASSDIPALAVKCLGLAARHLDDNAATQVASGLATMLAGGDEGARDVAAIAAKAAAADAGGPMAHALVARLVPAMLDVLKKEANSLDVTTSALDAVHDVVSRYGHLAGPQHPGVVAAALVGLGDDRAGVRKRATHVLAALAPSLSDAALDGVAGTLLDRLQAATGGGDDQRSALSALAAVSRAAGWRFGRHLGRAVPLVLAALRAPGEDEGDDERRETCLQALDACVLRSQLDARPHADAVLAAALDLLSHDPNYTEGMSDEEAGGDGDDDDGLSQEDFSDDADASWKVRRAAARCVADVAAAYPDDMEALYPRVGPALVARFRERDESVKADVFAAYVDVVRHVAGGRGAGCEAAKAALQADVGVVVAAAARQLKDRSLKTRAGALHVSTELTLAAPDAVASCADVLLPGVVAALNDRSTASSGLKLQALQFLRAAMARSPPCVWQAHAAQLTPPVTAAAGERYYKVAAEALRVVEALVLVVRPDPASPAPRGLAPLAGPLLCAAAARLGAGDVDAEVKDAAVSAAGAVLAHLGDVTSAEAVPVLAVLRDRLASEATRAAAARALARVARSPLGVDMSGVAEVALGELTAMLRLTSRPARSAALDALAAFAARDGSLFPPATAAAAVAGASPLVCDADLGLAAQALALCRELLRGVADSGRAVMADALPRALQLAASPLLQGPALDALQAFMASLLASGAAVGPDLVDALMKAGGGSDVGRAGQGGVAKCVAALCGAGGTSLLQPTVQRLLTTARDGRAAEAGRRLALLCVGECGREADLSGLADLVPVLTACLGDASEDVQGAAAAALGAACVGAAHALLPLVLSRVRAAGAVPREQYLLLVALDGAIEGLAGVPSGSPLAATEQQEVLNLLLASAESADEEVRAVAAECLGHLALLHGDTVLPALEAGAASPSPLLRAAAVTAVRHAVPSAPHPIDAALSARMAGFLALIGDPDRHVRKAAVQALSGAAHHKPVLVVSDLEAALPLLFKQAEVDPALVRVVDLGPFKHKIDDGLELRKAAFECMDVLLDAAPGAVDYPAFVARLESGLRDHVDVKLPCQLLLAKLAAAAPPHAAAGLDRFLGPLDATITAKVKSDAVKQEVDRNDELVRSALRAVAALGRVPGAADHASYKQYAANLAAGPLAEKWAAVCEERVEADGGADRMDTT